MKRNNENDFQIKMIFRFILLLYLLHGGALPGNTLLNELPLGSVAVTQFNESFGGTSLSQQHGESKLQLSALPFATGPPPPARNPAKNFFFFGCKKFHFFPPVKNFFFSLSSSTRTNFNHLALEQISIT